MYVSNNLLNECAKGTLFNRDMADALLDILSLTYPIQLQRQEAIPFLSYLVLEDFA